jgi:FixJ family two-component response regulator
MTFPASSAELIYVVDDDAAVRRSLERLLRSYGYRAVSFGNMDECLAASNVMTAQCVLADVAMPGGSGIDLAIALRQRGSRMPVLLVTAHDSDGIRRQGRQAGVVACLRKPVDAPALVEAIRQALDRGAAAGPTNQRSGG